MWDFGFTSIGCKLMFDSKRPCTARCFVSLHFMGRLSKLAGIWYEHQREQQIKKNEKIWKSENFENIRQIFGFFEDVRFFRFSTFFIFREKKNRPGFYLLNNHIQTEAFWLLFNQKLVWCVDFNCSVFPRVNHVFSIVKEFFKGWKKLRNYAHFGLFSRIYKFLTNSQK